MKIRITGTPEECAFATERIRATFDVQETSSFYPNRGDSVLGRVYIEATEPATYGRDGVARSTSPEVTP